MITSVGETVGTRPWLILKHLKGEMNRNEIAEAIGADVRFIASCLDKLNQGGKLDRRVYEGLLYFRQKGAPLTDLAARIDSGIKEWKCSGCLTNDYPRSARRTICTECRRVENRARRDNEQSGTDTKFSNVWLRKAIANLP